MASPPQLRTTESPPSAEGYRPVSVLAIAGLSIALLQSLLLLGFAINALVKGSPLVDPWILPFALISLMAGGLLSLLAWWQIRQSEGTRAGLALAKWGWWLSLLFGLGYLAYYFAIDAAVGLEAKKFTDKWLDKLRDGDINGAFVMTLDPERQKNITPNNPEDMKPFMVKSSRGPSDLQMFEVKDLTRFILQGGKDATVQSLGVHDWEYSSDAKTYQVRLSYRIQTEEGTMDCLLTVKGSKKSGGGRQWRITETTITGTPKLSDLGIAMDAWSNQSTKVAEGFLHKLAFGNTWEAYLDLEPPRERDRLRRVFLAWSRVHVATWAASAIGMGPGGVIERPASWALASTILPPAEGFRPFVEGKFLQGQEAFLAKQPTENEQQEARLRALLSVFRGPAGEYRLLHPGINSPLFMRIGRMATWKREPNDRMRLTHNYQLYLAQVGTGPREPPKYRYDIRLVTESDPGPVTIDRKPDWRIVSLELLDGGDTLPSQGHGLPNAREAPVPGGFPMEVGP
jgi:hypothetical protein